LLDLFISCSRIIECPVSSIAEPGSACMADMHSYFSGIIR